MLAAKNLFSGYKNTTVLRSVDIEVSPKIVTGLVGLNGAGKSTLLKTLAGAVAVSEGKIILNGEDITALPTQKRLKKGVALVPEGRLLFSSMTVEDNLKVSFLKTEGNFKDKLYYVYSLFPDLKRLKNKKAATLSGGQAQMVAISRAIMCGAKTLLLDEVTMGLSPKLVGEVFELVKRLSSEIDGVLLTGQEVERIQKVATRLYGIKHGEVFLLKGDLEQIKSKIC